MRCCRAMPIAEFIQTNEKVKQQAEGVNPIDWVVDRFLPDRSAIDMVDLMPLTTWFS